MKLNPSAHCSQSLHAFFPPDNRTESTEGAFLAFEGWDTRIRQEPDQLSVFFRCSDHECQNWFGRPLTFLDDDSCKRVINTFSVDADDHIYIGTLIQDLNAP